MMQIADGLLHKRASSARERLRVRVLVLIRLLLLPFKAIRLYEVMLAVVVVANARLRRKTE